MGLAVRDRAGPVAPGDPVVRDRVGPAALADRVGLGVLKDMNLVAPAVLEDMGPVDLAALADRASLGVRDWVDLVGPEDMGLADLVALGVPNRAGRGWADRGLRARELAHRVARDLSQDQARLARNLARPARVHLSRTHLDLNLPDPDRTRARLHRMPARLHRMPAHPHRIRAHLREPTHPGVATHLPEATHPAEATHPGEPTPGADAEGAELGYCEFGSH